MDNDINQRVREENDAIQDFFQRAGAPKRKKKRLALAVPATEPTPQVREKERQGAGKRINILTGEVSEVSRGKRATRGRGVIGTEQAVAAAPLSDDVIDNLPAPPSPPTPLSPPRQVDEEGEDEEVVGRPIYTNDTWAVAAIRRAKSRGADYGPSLFCRRPAPPSEVILKTKGEVNDGMRCRIVSFNSDGSFLWPKSSSRLCWHCCHPFEGPPAMIPRYYNRVHQYYEVYGNFCGWSCAKRFGNTSDHEYYSETAPSIDMFAHRYFGVALPIAEAPPRFLLDRFSEFGMSIDAFRSREPDRPTDFKMIQPPCVPYELLAVWKERSGSKRSGKTGYAKDIKNRFEQQMAGNLPLPSMPAPVMQRNATASKVPPSFAPIAEMTPGSDSGRRRKKQKNILSLF